MTIEEGFGVVIRRLRRERNLTQENLSVLSSIDRGFISNIEGGKQQPSIVTLYQLAKALNVPASSIIYETDFLLHLNSPTLLNKSSAFNNHWFEFMESAMDETLEKYYGSETILFVDDEKQLRDLISALLTKCGYTVILAEDGHEATELFELCKGKIHLVVMDIVMPRKDGISAFRDMVSVCPESKIILMSGYQPSHLNLENTPPIMQKPFSPIDLLKAVRFTIDGTSSQSS